MGATFVRNVGRNGPQTDKEAALDKIENEWGSPADMESIGDFVKKKDSELWKAIVAVSVYFKPNTNKETWVEIKGGGKLNLRMANDAASIISSFGMTRQKYSDNAIKHYLVEVMEWKINHQANFKKNGYLLQNTATI